MYKFIKKCYQPESGEYYYKTILYIDACSYEIDINSLMYMLCNQYKDCIVIECNIFADDEISTKFNNIEKINNFDNTLEII